MVIPNFFFASNSPTLSLEKNTTFHRRDTICTMGCPGNRGGMPLRNRKKMRTMRATSMAMPGVAEILGRNNESVTSFLYFPPISYVINYFTSVLYIIRSNVTSEVTSFDMIFKTGCRAQTAANHNPHRNSLDLPRQGL